MSKTFQHLTSPQREELLQLAKDIAAATQAERLICFGNRSYTRHHCSPFNLPEDEHNETTHLEYHLLLVQPPGDDRTEEVIAGIVKDITGRSLSVTCVVCSTEEMLEDLTTGNRFIYTVYQKGLMLHNAGNIPLTEPVATHTPMHIKERSEREWLHWITLARRQLTLAEHAAARQWSTETAGLLRQSVEQVCIALIRLYMGYRPKTDNLDGLFALMDSFCSIHRMLFPCCTDEENEIFNVFLVSRPEARYIDALTPHPDTAQTVLKRVKRLHEWAEQWHHHRMMELDRQITLHKPVDA